MGRVLEEHRGNSRAESRYGPDGRLAQVRTPSPAGGPDRVDQLHYDVLGRLRSYTADALGPEPRTERWAYDAAGRVRTSVDALGRRCEWRYDERGQCLGVTAPVGDVRGTLETSYDVAGRPVSLRGPDGSRQQISYDGYGRESEITVPAGAGPGVRLRVSHDGSDRVTAVRVVDAADTGSGGGGPEVLCEASLAYDEWGRVLRRSTGERRDVIDYDADQRTVRVVDRRGGTSTAVSDELGRLVLERDAVGNSTTTRYDTDAVTVESEDIGVGGARSTTNGPHRSTRYSLDPTVRPPPSVRPAEH